MDLHIKIRNGKFWVRFFEKIDLFKIVYSTIDAESLRTVRASNNPDSCSTDSKSLVTRMRRDGVSIEKINNTFLKFFNKHHGDFNIVCKTEGEENC